MSRLRSVMMVAVALVLAAAGVVAAMPPVPYFSQYDSRWSNDDIYVEYSGGIVSAEDVSEDFTGSVDDAKIQAAFAEDKIQSLSIQTEIFVGQGFDKCEIPTISQMQNWITNSPYGAVNLYIGGSCRSCPNSALTASYVSQLSHQGWKFIPTWVGPQSACWGGSCGSISNDPATAYNQGISEANAAIDVAIDLGLALADGSGTIIYYDLEGYDTTNTACRNSAKSFISGWTAQLHARGSEAGVYGSACGSAISDFTSISNVPDAIWPAHWIYSSYNSGATVWDVACLSNGIWGDHQRVRQYAGGHGETWGGVTLNIDCNVIDGIVASVGPADIIPLTGDMYGNGKDITGFYNANTAEFTFGGETARFEQMADKTIMSESGTGTTGTYSASKAGFFFDGKTDDTVNIEFADQGAELGVVSSSSSYDRQAAYNYAMQWWNSCNHDCSGSWDECSPYRYYGWECCGYPSHNGDCANFVSQCLIAGGHPYLTGEPDCKYPDGTLCCRGDCGKAEVGAKRLGDCLVSKGWERTCGYHTSPPSNIDVGDVLIYHAGSCDMWTAHATIVTYASGSDVKITCHSANKKNEPYTYMSTSHPYYEWLHYPSQPTIYPLTGDMYRSGTDATGTYNTGTAEFTFGGKTVIFAQIGDEPIIGDWDGDGYDEIGVFRSSASMFYLVTRNWADLPPSAGDADKDIPFPWPENIPIAGDWDGDGDDDIGGFNPGNNKFYLYTLNLGASSAVSYKDVPFGVAGDTPMIGDWDNDGDDDVAVCRKYDINDNPTYYFDLDHTGGPHELGPYEWAVNDDIPIAGRWNAGSGDKIGVYRPSTGEFIRNYNIPPDANNPPNTPSTPSGQGSGNTGTSYSYSTSATDPDGDQVKYTFDWDDGATSETGFVNSGTSASRSHSWSSAGTYYVKAMATDSKGASSGWSGSKVVTITNPNQPPNTPSNPSPSNHATGQSINADLSWTGGDPDAGDTVKYDVYFGISTSPPPVSNDQSGTTHDPGTLSYDTKYYWKITAIDNHGASTSGPLWDFTTGSAPNQPPTLSSGSVDPPSGDTSTTFDYYVTYTDSDGDAPTTRYVYVDGSPHTMTMISGDYTSGATFKYSTTLSAGSYNYYFYFDDDHGHTVRLPTSGTSSGPSVSTIDTTPPASITSLQNITGQTWINWAWANPPDSDFNHTMVYLNGVWKTNTSDQFYNVTGLNPETCREIATHTVDNVGNINWTWINDTATTLPAGCTPPDIAWNMTISATNQLEPVVVGMHPDATDGYDAEFDLFAETPAQGKVILILDDIYSTSVKKTRCYNESVSWSMSVGVPTGQTTTLSWNVPDYLNLTILEGTEILPSGSQLDEGSHELTVVAELLEFQEFGINLKAGWNIVSVPLIMDNNSVHAVFGDIPTLDTMPVKTWQSPLFIDATEIYPKVGYWVFTLTNTVITVTGTPIQNTTLYLGAGWNMVGTVGLSNLTLSDIPNQVPEKPAVTWVPPTFENTNVIEPGKSAWAFVTAGTIVPLTFGKGVSSESKAKAMPMITEIGSMMAASTTDEWNLTISAANQLEPVTFGIHPSATNGYDEYDVFSQTPVQGKVIMVLDNIYATEINKDELIWYLDVGVPAGQTTNLMWDSSMLPADVALTLDEIDMRLQTSIELGDGAHSFVINGSTRRIPGDLNHDGNVTSADVRIALDIAFSGVYMADADVDANGCVNVLDARMIMLAAAGRIDL